MKKSNLYCVILYTSGSQSLWDRGLVNSFFIRRGPGTGPRSGGWETLLYTKGIKCVTVRSELLELWQRSLVTYGMWWRVVWCISTKISDEPAVSICRIEDANVAFIMKHNKIRVFWDVTPSSQVTCRRIILLSFSVHRKDSLNYYANLKYNIPVSRYRAARILVDPSCNFLWNFGRYVPNYKLLHFRREKSLYSQQWEANFYRMQVSSSTSTLYYLSTRGRVVTVL
jgi:hypothetical protein